MPETRRGKRPAKNGSIPGVYGRRHRGPYIVAPEGLNLMNTQVTVDAL